MSASLTAPMNSSCGRHQEQGKHVVRDALCAISPSCDSPLFLLRHYLALQFFRSALNNNDDLIKAPFLAPSRAKMQSTICATCNFSCLGAFLHISIVFLSSPPSFAFSDLCQRIPRHGSQKIGLLSLSSCVVLVSFLSMSVRCFSSCSASFIRSRALFLLVLERLLATDSCGPHLLRQTPGCPLPGL